MKATLDGAAAPLHRRSRGLATLIRVTPRDVREVWSRILTRARDSFSGFEPHERIIFRVFIFLTDLEMGDLTGFMYNISPSDGPRWSELRETADAVETIGHVACAATLRDLAERLEALPPFSTTWGEFLDPVREHVEGNVKPLIESYAGDVSDQLATYTIQHFG
jgi:hypothetical protein